MTLITPITSEKVRLSWTAWATKLGTELESVNPLLRDVVLRAKKLEVSPQNHLAQLLWLGNTAVLAKTRLPQTRNRDLAFKCTAIEVASLRNRALMAALRNNAKKASSNLLSADPAGGVEVLAAYLAGSSTRFDEKTEELEPKPADISDLEYAASLAVIPTPWLRRILPIFYSSTSFLDQGTVVHGIRAAIKNILLHGRTESMSRATTFALEDIQAPYMTSLTLDDYAERQASRDPQNWLTRELPVCVGLSPPRAHHDSMSIAKAIEELDALYAAGLDVLQETPRRIVLHTDTASDRLTAAAIGVSFWRIASSAETFIPGPEHEVTQSDFLIAETMMWWCGISQTVTNAFVQCGQYPYPLRDLLVKAATREICPAFALAIANMNSSVSTPDNSPTAHTLQQAATYQAAMSLLDDGVFMVGTDNQASFDPNAFSISPSERQRIEARWR